MEGVACDRVELEAKEREGSKREGMIAGWPGGTKSKRLHTSTVLEDIKPVWKVQGSKAVAVRQGMGLGRVLGTMSWWCR
jgi:hypothetical protein